MTDIIKAISLWQPWASLWITPNKRHETRHWPTSHRGRLLVHAAKRLADDLDDDLDSLCRHQFGENWRASIRYGAILGMVDLTDVVPTSRLHYTNPDRLTEEDRADLTCGDFSECRYGWRRGGYWAFTRPVPYRGRQGLFDVPIEVVAEAIQMARVFI